MPRALDVKGPLISDRGTGANECHGHITIPALS